MQPDIERRACPELRAVKDESRLEGYAAVFNSRSEKLPFREVILPGAFDRAIRENHDVRALIDHDSGQILGRTKSGTLRLSVDQKGLKASIDVDTEDPDGAKALRRVRRGDLDGMSFAFRTITDNWRIEDGEDIRELVDLELLDVSVVAYPAYLATSVSARAIDHAESLKTQRALSTSSATPIVGDQPAEQSVAEAAVEVSAEPAAVTEEPTKEPDPPAEEPEPTVSIEVLRARLELDRP